MSVIFATLMMFGSATSSLPQLPSDCTNPGIQCIRATQWPERWGGPGVNVLWGVPPDPPVPSPPFDYMNFATEAEYVTKRLADLNIEYCHSGACSVQLLGTHDWFHLPFDLPGGFINAWSVNGRKQDFVALPTGATCGPGTSPPCPFEHHIQAPVTCPAGFTFGGTDPSIGYYCYRAAVAPCCSGGPINPERGNPIDIFRLRKVQVETDWSSGLLRVERRYHSESFPDAAGAGAIPHPLSAFWRGNYERRLIEVMGAGVPIAQLERQNGDIFSFAESTGGYFGSPNAPGTLKRILNGGNPAGWSYESTQGEVETYDVSGQLVGIETRDGHVVLLTYDANGYLDKVVDERGRALQFVYDDRNRLASVTLPDGGALTYEYKTTNDAGIEIWKTHFPDGAIKTYNYDQPYAAAPLLTSIVDEKGITYATFTYNSSTGRPLSSTHAGGIDTLTMVTNASTPYVYDDPLGQRHTILAQTTAGALRIVGETTSCTGCPTLSNAVHYDSVGNVDWTTDFSSNKTTYIYDPVRFVETSRTEASSDTSPPATSTKRTIDTVWNPNFRVRDQRSVKNASGTMETLTKWAYNARGQATARCQIDPAIGGASSYACGSLTNALAGVRQSTTMYCEQTDVTGGTCPLVGLVKSTNGARLTTDPGMGGLDDTTTYTYYQTDDATCATGGACPHRKGDLWKVTNALSEVTEYISYDKNGRITRIKDANATYTDFVYHVRGWLTQRIVRTNASGTPSLGDAKLQMDYDAVGNVTQVTQPDGSYLQYTYDDAHRLIKINDNLSNAIDYCPGGIGSANCLDAAGNRKVEYVQDPSLSVKRQLYRTYNTLGQLTQVLNAASTPVESSNGLTETNVVDDYDRNGNRVLTQDGLGVQTKREFDPLNRLKTTIQNYNNFGADPATYHTSTGYFYDTRDNLRQVADPDGLNTVYTYDGLNNLTNLSSPDTGGTAYGYDKAGNRISQTDNRVPSVTSTYTYDALNRLTAIGYPTSSLNVTYAYDQADGVTGCSGSFPKGRLTRMTDTSGSTTYCYDRRGNVLKKTQVTDATNFVTQYTYTTADKVLTITYPSGAIVTYTRDALGRVQTITWKANAGATAINLVNNATYYPFGPLNVLTFGNGRTLTKTYDKDYAIDSISGAPAGALTLDLGVDVMGDITSASGTISPPNPDRTYQYDPLYRLSTAKTGATPLEAYAYNKTGDRLSASLNGGAAQVYTYAAGTHRLASVGGAARTSDLNGNLTSVPASAFPLVYDDRNRLVQAKTTGLGGPNVYTYTFSGSGERVLKSSGTSAGTIYEASVWDIGGRPISTHARTDGGSGGSFGAAAVVVNATWDEIIYLDSIPVGLARDGVVYYIEADHLGTPRQVIDRTRSVAIWKWDSLGNTFGTAAPNQDPDMDTLQFIFNLRFPGQSADAETALNYNYFRDYEPETGRYAESDPIGLSGGLDTYAYVSGKPLQFADDYGLCSRWQQYYWERDEAGFWHVLFFGKPLTCSCYFQCLDCGNEFATTKGTMIWNPRAIGSYNKGKKRLNDCACYPPNW